MGKFTSVTSIEPITSFYVYFPTGMFSDSSPFENSQVSKCLPSHLTLLSGLYLGALGLFSHPYSRSELVELQRISIPTFFIYRSEVICPSIKKEFTWQYKNPRTEVWGPGSNLCHSLLTWPLGPRHASISANHNFPPTEWASECLLSNKNQTE